MERRTGQLALSSQHSVFSTRRNDRETRFDPSIVAEALKCDTENYFLGYVTGMEPRQSISEGAA